MHRAFDDERTNTTPSNAHSQRPSRNHAPFRRVMQTLSDTGMTVTFQPSARSNSTAPLIAESSPPRGRLPRSAVPGEGPGTQKPYPCNHCDRWFSCPHNVHQHYNEKHNPDKPYKCELCAGKVTASGKPKGEFARPGTLNRHNKYVHKKVVPTSRRSTLGKRSRSLSVEEVGSSDDESCNKSLRLHGQHDVHQSDSNRSGAALAIFNPSQTTQQPIAPAFSPYSNASLVSYASNPLIQNDHVITPLQGTSRLNGHGSTLLNGQAYPTDHRMAHTPGAPWYNTSESQSDSLSSFLDNNATSTTPLSLSSHQPFPTGQATTSNHDEIAPFGSRWSDSVVQSGHFSTLDYPSSHPTSHPRGYIPNTVTDNISGGHSDGLPHPPNHGPHPTGLCLPGHGYNQPNQSDSLPNISNSVSNHSNSLINDFDGLFGDLDSVCDEPDSFAYDSDSPSNYSSNPSDYANDISSQSRTVPLHSTSMPSHSYNQSNSSIDPSLINQQPITHEDAEMSDAPWNNYGLHGGSADLPDLSAVQGYNMNHDFDDATNNDHSYLASIGSWAFDA